MAWTLQFHRRVGDAPLTLADVDRCFSGRQELTRIPEEPEGSPDEVRFERAGADGRPSFAFVFSTRREDEDPPRPDFPFVETPFLLEVDYHLADPGAQPELRSILAAATDAAAELRLLASDPQVEQDIPGPVLPERLAQSFAVRRAEILETVRYFEGRRKRMLGIAGALLLAALALAVLITLGGGRG